MKDQISRDSVLEDFERLGFEFGSPHNDRQLGFATGGKVGIVEVVDRPSLQISVLLSTNCNHSRSAGWVGACLATVASATRTDFASWYRQTIEMRGYETEWAYSCLINNHWVSAEFHPIDVMLITVETDSVLGKRNGGTPDS